MVCFCTPHTPTSSSSRSPISASLLCMCLFCACISQILMSFPLIQPVWECQGLQEEGECNSQWALVPCQHGSASREACPSRTAPTTVQITPFTAISLTDGEVRDYGSRLFPPSINAAVAFVFSFSPSWNEHTALSGGQTPKQPLTLVFKGFNLILKHITKSVCKYPHLLN